MLAFGILIGLAIGWFLFWAIVIAIQTKGKITIQELAIHAFVVGATVTETKKLPSFTPNWREEMRKE